MKKSMCISAVLAWSLMVQANLHADPKETVVAAAKKLADAGGYTWVNKRDGSRFFQGQVKGQVRKDGAVLVENPGMQGDTYLMAISGEHRAAETQDGWQSLAEMQNAEGFGRFFARMVEQFKTPSEEIADLVQHVEAFTGEGDSVEGKLKTDGVEAMLSFGGRGGQGPEISNPSGHLKVSLKDGSLTGYVLTLKGSMSFNGNDFELDRISNVTISEVGSTEFEIPEAAQAKLK